MKDIINKKVIIKTGIYKNEWGIVKGFDGDYYHIALWNGDTYLIFDRKDIRVSKNQEYV